MSETHSQTRFLNGFWAGDDEKTRELGPRIVNELQKIAAADARKNPAAWQGIDLDEAVGEVWARLARPAARKEEGETEGSSPSGKRWNDRKHFYRTAARAIRFLRIDAERRRQEMQLASHHSLPDFHQAPPPEAAARDEQLLRLDEALRELSVADPEAAEVVELHYFGVRFPAGDPPVPFSPASPLTYAQIGELIDRSAATVCLRMRRGLEWLRRRLGAGSREGQP